MYAKLIVPLNITKLHDRESKNIRRIERDGIRFIKHEILKLDCY